MTFLGFFPFIICLFFFFLVISLSITTSMNLMYKDVQSLLNNTQKLIRVSDLWCVCYFFSYSSWFRNSVKQKGIAGFVSPRGTAKFGQPSQNSGFGWKEIVKGKVEGKYLLSTQSGITREGLITVQLYELWQEQARLHCWLVCSAWTTAFQTKLIRSLPFPSIGP